MVIIGSDITFDVLPYVRQFYPTCRSVYAVTAEDLSLLPPDKIVTRSRGRHQPGSGNYFCQIITPSNRMQGWWVEPYLFVTSLKSDKGGYERENVTWAQRTFALEAWQTYGRNATVYFAYRYEFVGFSGRTMIMRKYEIRGSSSYHDYEGAKDDALSKEATVQDVIWRFSYNLGGISPIFSHNPAPSYLADYVDTWACPNIGVYLNEVYCRAYQSMPAITTNNIQNIQGILHVLKAILSGITGGGDLALTGVGSLRDAWLGYRYSYCTTKADIEELSQYVERMHNLSDADSITGHGFYRVESGEASWDFRCALKVSLTDMTGILSEVERLGLALDGYNAWDLIPYSFVLDWFLHIGDMLEKARSRSYAMRLSPSAVWYSITHDYDDSEGAHICEYYRFEGWNHMVDATLPASILDHRTAAGQTWVKRAADAFCLFS